MTNGMEIVAEWLKDLERRIAIQEQRRGGNIEGWGNIDGGEADTNYGGSNSIDAGGEGATYGN